MKRSLWSAVILVFALLLMAGSAASVPLTLNVSSGVSSTSVSSATGSVAFSGLLGQWNVVVAVGTSDPILINTPSEASLDLTSQVVRSLSGSDSLVLDLKGTGYTLNTAVNQWLEHAAIGGTLQSGSVTWEKILFDAQGNKIFDETFGSFGPTPGQRITFFGEHADFSLSPDSTFSMESIITINTGVGQITSFNADNITTATTVPEPGALLLIGFGLVSLSALRNKVSAR